MRIQDGVATVVIDRPDRLNALNASVVTDLGTALDDIEAADGVRALFVTGAGERAFCAGADLDELNHLDATEAERWLRAGHLLFDRLLRFPVPSIAVVNGLALGGGLELALSCSLAVACDEAKLGLPETRLGLLPGLGGTQRLAALVGRQRALRVVLSGVPLSARDAWDLGMLSHPPVPRRELHELCELIATQLRTIGPDAAAAALRLHVAAAPPLESDAIDDEIRAAATAIASPEGSSGITAFLERVEPPFARRSVS